MAIKNIGIATGGVKSFKVDGTGLNKKLNFLSTSRDLFYVTLVCISPRPDPLISIFLMHLILLIWEMPAGLEFAAA